jgi:hypothetical protein
MREVKGIPNSKFEMRKLEIGRKCSRKGRQGRKGSDLVFLIVNSLFLPAVVMAVVLMLGLEVPVWADEDDDEKAEMRDFVAAVYRGQGQYNMAGSIATGEGGVIMKRGSVWLTPHGQYQKVGSVYLTPDGGVVTRAGSTFIDEDEVITKAGSTYTGNGQTTTTAGNVVLKPGWATR